MTITKFLEARIDEDEAEVQAALLLRGSGTYWRIGHPLDPARVLAECAAKRAIIAACERIEDQRLDSNAWSMDSTEEKILGPLAAVYKDHPDFQQEWMPR